MTFAHKSLSRLFILAAPVFSQPVVAQTVAVGAPDAVASHPFTLIKGMRELADGRVLVTDWIEGRLVVVDFSSDIQRDIGRIGSGPKEFRLPGRLIAMPGDSTMLVDVGNARLTVIGPQLDFVRSMSNRAHGERFAMTPRAIDRRATLYFGVSPFSIASGPQRADSVPIARWAPGDPAVAMIPDLLIKAYTSKPPGPSVGLPYVAFAAQDDWAAAPDGWVAVVRSDPYRVEWYGPDDERVIGDVVDYEVTTVTMDDRRDNVRRFMASTMQSGRGEGGGMGLVSAEAQSPKEIERIANIALFAEEFPAFEPGGVWISGETVWVQRALRVGNFPTFDVFDRDGSRQRTFTLPLGRRIVGFGERSLYATFADEFDLLALERYPIPEGGR